MLPNDRLHSTPKDPQPPPLSKCLTNALPDWNALPVEIRNPSYNAFRILLLIRTDLNLSSSLEGFSISVFLVVTFFFVQFQLIF